MRVEVRVAVRVALRVAVRTKPTETTCLEQRRRHCTSRVFRTGSGAIAVWIGPGRGASPPISSRSAPLSADHLHDCIGQRLRERIPELTWIQGPLRSLTCRVSVAPSRQSAVERQDSCPPLRSRRPTSPTVAFAAFSAARTPTMQRSTVRDAGEAPRRPPGGRSSRPPRCSDRCKPGWRGHSAGGPTPCRPHRADRGRGARSSSRGSPGTTLDDSALRSGTG